MPRATIFACHGGSLAEGAAAMRPIERFGSPVVDTLGRASDVDTNTTVCAPAFLRGARNSWQQSVLAELHDAAIDALIAPFAGCSSPMSGPLLVEGGVQVGVGR